MSRLARLACILAVAVAACTGVRGNVSDALCLSGTVWASGHASVTTVLVTTDDGHVLVEGPLGMEVGSLEGGIARVCGSLSGTAPLLRMNVSRYAVVSMNGEPAWDGILEVRDEILLLVSNGFPYLLVDPPAELREGVGRRIWISGGESEVGLAVRSYGWIR